MKKIFEALFFIAVFSFSLNAQAGGPGGGPGGPGGPGAPGGYGGPGGNPSAPPPSAPPAPSSPPSSGGGSSGSSSSPLIINYRGERKAAVDAPLEVLCTSLTKKNENYNYLVHFNQAVSPSKITGENIFFNGKNMENRVIIKFNRRADSVTIIWSQSLYSEEEIKNISIQIKNVQSFDGKFIEEIKVK